MYTNHPLYGYMVGNENNAHITERACSGPPHTPMSRHVRTRPLQAHGASRVVRLIALQSAYPVTSVPVLLVNDVPKSPIGLTHS